MLYLAMDSHIMLLAVGLSQLLNGPRPQPGNSTHSPTPERTRMVRIYAHRSPNSNVLIRAELVSD
jgi:hypothetical protein